jgi:hypothetical protein
MGGEGQFESGGACKYLRELIRNPSHSQRGWSHTIVSCVV